MANVEKKLTLRGEYYSEHHCNKEKKNNMSDKAKMIRNFEQYIRVYIWKLRKTLFVIYVLFSHFLIKYGDINLINYFKTLKCFSNFYMKW
jgi:hypothetical protein